MRHVRPPTPEDLAAARELVASRLPPTPLVTSRLGDLKLETAQPTGSFKVRGGLAALAHVEPGRPVVACSAGNHGLGVAYAAAELGVEATVVLPETASAAKVAKLQRLPVTIERRGSSYAEAEARALEIAAQGAVFVSPYNDPHVIAGQATIGPELPDAPLSVVTPVGGGGLIGGLVLWAAGRRDVRVVGVEAAASPAIRAAVTAGRIVPIEVGATLADGLAGNLEPGSITVGLAARANALVTVEEAEIEAAIRWLAAEHGLIAEGAGAAAVAAVLAGRAAAQPGERLVMIVTGRNIALPVLAEVLAGRA